MPITNIRFFCLLLPILLKTMSLQATQIIISGKAASTLYVCDDYALLDCWYGNQTSYCEFHIDKNPEFSTNTNQVLIVRGELAELVYNITRNCYDKDIPKYRYHYGKQGVKCIKIGRNYSCWLHVDNVSSLTLN